MADSPFHTICATCQKQFSEEEATQDTRKLFTDNSPFSELSQEDALLKEAGLLMNFSEVVSSMAATCDDTCNEFAASIFNLLTLLSEESQHRLTEVEILREGRASMQAKGRVQS
jgi:hypothetical protein